VRIAASKGMSLDFSVAYGQMVKTMAKQNGGIIGMNASGFNDPKANSKGGVPWGFVISNGKILLNNRFPSRYGGGLIGFDKENRLILAKNVTAQKAIEMGIRDGIQYGPFLIVNGEPAYIKGNGGGGYQPRSVIAQRKDGIVLMLVIDGRSSYSNGATYYDLVNVLMDYGAYNASNLDGGTSSSLNLNNEIINKPMNILGQQKTRTVPNAWIVLK
jgi:exopolysaccharide biosynthesis protein